MSNSKTYTQIFPMDMPITEEEELSLSDDESAFLSIDERRKRFVIN